MTVDKRYSIAREYCGYDTPRWVVRFCGDWIGQHASKEGARALAEAHAEERSKAWNHYNLHKAASGEG